MHITFFHMSIAIPRFGVVMVCIRIFQGIMLRANFAKIKCPTKMLKLWKYNIDQFYNKYSCNFHKKDYEFSKGIADF